MQLQLLDIMDLSRNMLDGVIPVELCTLSGLRDNKFISSIPPSMSNITSLSHLDLSHNNFSGKILKGNQLQTLNDPSIYADNLQLCEDPLPEKCPGNDEQVQPPMSTSNKD
ncbi:LRR domain containing protein [Parasponia andersonii]|uniref:LRR domain containing protein n=1 Tax=Parasponia andersonii TaxID=3476 RepID=A0A2P5BSC3_PARAD|nr:LRR domain containing protein [Parasponia andersonii]